MKRTPHVLADTGPLYALLDEGDRLAPRAERELAQLEREGAAILVATTTLLEAYTLVMHRFDAAVARRWLKELRRGTGALHPLYEDIEDGVARAGRLADQRVTLFDATLAALSARLSVPVWSFDHHFDALRVAVWRGGSDSPKPSPD